MRRHLVPLKYVSRWLILLVKENYAKVWKEDQGNVFIECALEEIITLSACDLIVELLRLIVKK